MGGGCRTCALPARRRGRLLLWVEALGKWSLIDAFVLVMMMVAFKFHISLSEVTSWPIMPPTAAVVDVLVNPKGAVRPPPSSALYPAVVSRRLLP